MRHLSDLSHLLSPKELCQELPLTSQQAEFVSQSRQSIANLLNGKDSRLLLIVGPCSIHDITAAKEYATKLRHLVNDVSDNFLILMRVYFEKPRTNRGWKGLLSDPYLNGTHAIEVGLRLARQLLLDLAEMGIPAATEFLDPLMAYYLCDLVSWVCIGARTTESQIHRQMASGLPMPVAFKNNTSGNIEGAINGVLSASESHSFVTVNRDGGLIIKQSKGNPDGHIVLRGGKNKPNFDPASISQALSLLENAGLPKRIIVDCAHDNSNRDHVRQIYVFQSVIHQFIQGNQFIRGILLESNLFAGNQSLGSDLSQLQYAVSLTDPCLDWNTTENLILWADTILNKGHNFNKISKEVFHHSTQTAHAFNL